MLTNTTKAKLLAGKTVHGCFLKYSEPALAEIIAMVGFDFILFDGEHGTLEPSEIENLVRAVELRGATPLARVTTNQPQIILRYLDTGLHGVQVPWVNTTEDVELAVQYTKYGPRGIRGLAGGRASDWGLSESIGDYTARANRETMLIVHIETADAVELVEEYVEVDGVDVLFLGPTDLSHSLGHPGQVDHPDVQAAMRHTADVVTSSDKALGIYAPTAEFAIEWQTRGARYVATGVEEFLLRGIRTYLEEVRT
ncbi:MAG: HpcH/HpaI aldolase/citrate lyase family protein [Acidimicrobiia bacterium]